MASRDDMVITPTLASTRQGRRRKAALSSAAQARVAARGGGGLVRFGGRLVPLAVARAMPVVMVVAVIAAIVVRITSGRTFESLGAMLREATIGAMSDEDKARRFALGQLQGSQRMMDSVTKRGNPEHLQRRFDFFFNREVRRLRGQSKALLVPGFTTSTTGEIMIERGMDFLDDAGMLKAVDDVIQLLREP